MKIFLTTTVLTVWLPLLWLICLGRTEATSRGRTSLKGARTAFWVAIGAIRRTRWGTAAISALIGWGLGGHFWPADADPIKAGVMSITMTTGAIWAGFESFGLVMLVMASAPGLARQLDRLGGLIRRRG